MRRIVKLDKVQRFIALFLAVIMAMSAVPFGVFARTPATVSTTIGETEFVVGKATVFTISTLANDDANERVIGTAEFSDPSAIEELKYYETNNGQWYDLEGDFGPSTGFPMSDATSTFQVTFKKAGIYNVDIFIKSVNDGSVICSTTATAYVSGSSTLTTDAGKKTFVVGESTEFEFETVANDDAGKMVIGAAEFSDPDAFTGLEYCERDALGNETWYPLTGEFGPSTGFQMSDEISTFRLTFVKAGTYTLTAYMKEVDTGDILCFTVETITVKNRSEFSFDEESMEIKFSDVNAYNNSINDEVEGAEYTYESDNENVVKVDENGILTPTGIGEATITVTRKENASFVAASATYTVKVVAGVQGELTWNNTVPDSIKWNDQNGYSNTVSGGSGSGAVTYTSDNTEVAEVDPETGVLTLKKPGTVTITATKDGAGLYDDQSTSYTLVVTTSEQTPLYFVQENPNAIYVGNVFENVALGGSVDAIVYKSSDEAVAIVDENGKVTALSVPEGQEFAVVTITASIAANDYYEAVSAEYTLTIYRALQNVSFEKGTTDQKIKYGESYTNAIIGNVTSPVTYKSSDESIATVSEDGTVTALKAGTVTITATVPETQEYQECVLTYELVIEHADQVVNFANGNTQIPAIIYGDSYRNAASAITAIKYVSSDPSVADVNSDGELVIKKAGTVTITAIAEETDKFAQASSSYTITINKAKQTVSFEKGESIEVTFNDNENKFSNPASTNATVSEDELDKKDIDVTYSIESGSEYVVDGTFDPGTGFFEIKGAGTVIVSVSFTANDRFEAIESSYTVVVNKDAQSISFAQKEYEMINGDNGFESPIAKEDGKLFGTRDIIYTIDNNDDGVVSAIDSVTGALTFTNKTGKVTVRATKPADDNYNEATVTYTLTVKDAELGENVFFSIVGEKINESDWYTGNVSIKAAEGYLVSYSKEADTAEWLSQLTDAVTDDGTYSVTFHIKDKATGQIYEAETVEIRKDATDPSAQIDHKELSSWEKFLSIITIGLWKPAEMNFTIAYEDVTSGIAKVEYCVVEGDTEVRSEAELDSDEGIEWKEYNGSIVVGSDKIFVVYAKVTDNAGQHIFATTNGIVFDKTAPGLKIEIETAGSDGFYDTDVKLNVIADDAQPSSGIASITYKIESATESEFGSLYEFNIDNPEFKDLESHIEKELVVDSKTFNSDNVKVTVTVTDNAGSSTEQEIVLNICIDKPELLGFEYIDDPEIINSKDGVDYYSASRKAKIVIKARNSVFGATRNNCLIDVLQSAGNSESELTYVITDFESTDITLDGQATHTLYIEFKGSANYKYSVEYTDVFGNKVEGESEKFAVDLDTPTASVTVDESNTWHKLLETLTFGLWKNEKVTVKASSNDKTSPVKKFEMYVTDSDEILTSVQLDALYEDGKFSEYKEFTVAEDAKFVVYIRVEDYAGRYDYVCSDGFVVDMTESEIVITPEHTDRYHNEIPLYNGDVDVRIDVSEKKEDSSSGIKEVKYWVVRDGVVVTQEDVLYSFNYKMEDYVAEGENVPAYNELPKMFTETVTIDAVANNSCDVVLYVSVTDNAGNVDTKSIKVDIDVTAPTIKVEYNNNSPYKIVGDRGYYPENRTATIIINERSGHFEPAKATAGIKIKAVDVLGNPIAVNGAKLEVDADGYIVDIAKLFGNVAWESKLGETPDGDTHTLALPYNHDANYTFAISYADLASNGNAYVNTDGQKTPYEFTVDKADPTATITVGSNTWSKLLEVLTFGIYNSESVNVIATAEDETSPLESIEFYKTDLTEILSFEDLENVTSWTDITSDPEFEISEDERFVVYLKVTDQAGNYIYISSDGYIVDKTKASITLTPEHTDLTHNNIPLYNGDVDVLINVVEMIDGAYSGIKEVKYWVTRDGEISQEEVILYSFDKATPKYEDLCHEFTETVTIVAENNNSCNVVLYVTVTDNAGNVNTESVAVDIDITVPTIMIDFDNDSAYKVVEDKGYFPESRKATVIITERAAHFDASKATESIKITAVDVNGNEVIADCSKLVGVWKSEGDTHTAVIDFSADANYEFVMSYEDLATNECKYENIVFADGTVAPRYFAVDKTAPTGTVTAGELGTWDKLIEILTFGLWSKDTVDVTGTSSDATTPIESVSYYKTAGTVAKTVEELNTINSWIEFDKLSVPADEQFVVYIRIVDYAGNVTYISTNGIIVDDTAPAIESVKPEITITPEPTHGIYNSDVAVAVKVVDPKTGETNAFAGLREIRYEIFNMGAKTQDGILYSFDTSNPTHGELKQEWSYANAITVDKNLNNSNDVKIVVYAVDNAGNDNMAECNIKIDITAPTIDVIYDNNSGDSTFKESVYFKADRIAKIVVTERNFDPSMVKLVISNTDEYVPMLSAWTTVEGKGNGDSTTHMATVVFDQDGDYTFEISCTDAAMNANTAVDYNKALAPNAFTVDKTAPVVSVVYDNNSFINGNYYKAERIATITVTEHNFEIGRIKIALKATNNGKDSALPAVSDWIPSTDNTDVYTATITYEADSLYVFDFDYTDKAGNATADIAEQTFYVDRTAPELRIENIVDESANNNEGNIGFIMIATDTNFDKFVPVLSAVVKNGNTFETKQLESGKIEDLETGNGKKFEVTNIEADGIYRITCTLVDLAGNAYEKVTLVDADGNGYSETRFGEDTLLTFSVNRDGSAFEVDEQTVGVVEQYYVQNVENDVVIVEINADPLKEYAVTLNGKTLEKDKDYTVAEEGGNGSWMKYTYKVNKALFAEEGEYKLVVSSKDKADNNSFSDVKKAAVEFVVDRTAPVVTISGIGNDGRYQTDKQTVTLIPTDDGGALNTLIVNLVDENGNVIKEVVNLAGEALITELEANGGKITFEIAEGLYQNVQIICTDCATGNTAETNTHDTTIKNVSVSSSVFMIFWANKPLRWGTIAGVSAAVIALAVFIFLKKKKHAAK